MSSFDHPRASASLDAVEWELRAQRWHLGFAPDVEARFEADQGKARARELVYAGIVALLVYNSFLVNDRLLRPEVFGVALIWRLGCLTAYSAAVLVLAWRGLAPRLREAAVASTIVVATFASGMIFRATTSPSGIYDPFVFSLIFLAGNISLRLRFTPAIISSTLALAIAAGFVVSQRTMPAGARAYALGLLLGTAVFTVLAGYRIERSTRKSYLLLLREELRSQAAVRTADEFEVLSQTDALTQLPNRRAFETALQQRWIAAAERQVGLVVLMLDIDNFKRFNDQHGHPAGDECLRQVAAAMRASIRGSDFIARIGGEEFVVLLPAATPAAVQVAAERLRDGVERLGIRNDSASGQAVVTISIGIAMTSPAKGSSPSALMAAADAALYEAKRSGRNRWIVAMVDMAKAE